MTAELKGIHAKTFQDLDVIKDVLKLDEEKIAELEKENAELKSRDCWKSCEYANPKAELIGQHIKDVQNLTKAKELLKHWIELYKPKLEGYPITPIQEQTEQFLSEVENV